MALTVLFQGHESEDRMWRLIGDRRGQPCHRTPISFDELALQEHRFDALSLAIPATAGLLVMVMIDYTRKVQVVIMLFHI